MKNEPLLNAMKKEQAPEKEFCVIVTLGVKDDNGNWKSPPPDKMKVVPFVIKWRNLYDDNLLATAIRGCVLSLNKE